MSFPVYTSSNCTQNFDRQKLTHTRRATCKLLELVSESDSFVLHNKMCSSRFEHILLCKTKESETSSNNLQRLEHILLCKTKESETSSITTYKMLFWCE